ncbi:MAG: 3-oxoacyl-[acyl-carrier protein] reductase, partial [uncultured Craurococcus sp.]
EARPLHRPGGPRHRRRLRPRPRHRHRPGARGRPADAARPRRGRPRRDRGAVPRRPDAGRRRLASGGCRGGRRRGREPRPAPPAGDGGRPARPRPPGDRGGGGGVGPALRRQREGHLARRPRRLPQDAGGRRRGHGRLRLGGGAGRFAHHAGLFGEQGRGGAADAEPRRGPCRRGHPRQLRLPRLDRDADAGGDLRQRRRPGGPRRARGPVPRPPPHRPLRPGGGGGGCRALPAERRGRLRHRRRAPRRWRPACL